MSDFQFVLIIIIAIAAVILLFTTVGKQLRVKFKGRADELMNKDASTPEGAKDYYNAAIMEKQEFYQKASQSFAEVSGRLDAAEKDLYQAQKDKNKILQQINSCLDSNDEDTAKQYAMRKVTLDEKIEVLKNTINELKAAKQQQQEIRDHAGKSLQELREEKERVVFQMEADEQIIDLHNSMDSLSINNESERMLEKVREGAKKKRQHAEGTKIAYDSSEQAMDIRLKKSERDRSAQDVLDEIKRQRGKS